MYVLLMLVSPLLLLHGGRRGWGFIAAGSVLLWLGAQLDLGTYLYESAAHWARIPVPVHQTGAFSLPGWQLLWVAGLWMGARAALGLRVAPTFPRWLVVAAWTFALTTLLWRHAMGQTPWPVDGTLPAALNAAFDKWHLGPLRLLNLFVLGVLVLHHGPALAARMRRPKTLELLGRASLPVFCAHLVLALLALAAFGDKRGATPFWVENLVLFGTFAALYAVAAVSNYSAKVGQKKRAPEGVAGVVQVKRV
jgi:hypothetical protein